MHRLQDINGNTYQYDPNSGAILYGQADADAFTYDTCMTTYFLTACGCPAETGCQCRQEIKPMTTAAASSASRRTVYRTMYTPPDTPTKTPLSEIRAGVERIRREVAAEKEGREVRRRVRNEIARDFEYVRQNPVTNGYSAALAPEHGSELELDIYQHGSVPQPYSLALGEIVPRRADGSPARLPEGDDPPDGYALALEARRQPDEQHNDN